MILECPNCHARFLVADALIPAEGRTVRCGACAHQWHVQKEVAPGEEPAVATAPPPVEEPVEAFVPSPGSNVPAVAKRRLKARPFKIAAAVLLMLWAILAVITYFPSWQGAPGVGAIYTSLLGDAPVDGLVFADVHMEKNDAGESKTQFVIQGSIVNHAADTRIVPTVRVKLKDEQGKTVWSREYEVKEELKAGEVYPFRIANIETTMGSSVKTIMLDLGHGLQLMVRP
jgi:predicted Zn finger-like uncharacterized protein